MPTMFQEFNLLAGAANPSIFAGQAYEFARQRAVVSFGLTANATGTFTQVQVGARTIATEFQPPVATVYPIIPDDFYITDVAEANDRILVPWRNPTGGNIVVRGVVQLSA